MTAQEEYSRLCMTKHYASQLPGKNNWITKDVANAVFPPPFPAALLNMMTVYTLRAERWGVL